MTLFNRSPSPKVSSRRQSHSGPVDLEHCPGDKNGANKDGKWCLIRLFVAT
jgi:hypothetical protein